MVGAWMRGERMFSGMHVIRVLCMGYCEKMKAFRVWAWMLSSWDVLVLRMVLLRLDCYCCCYCYYYVYYCCSCIYCCYAATSSDYCYYYFCYYHYCWYFCCCCRSTATSTATTTTTNNHVHFRVRAGPGAESCAGRVVVGFLSGKTRREE